jgi:hypothetical protein
MARAACKALVVAAEEADEENSLSVRLLVDIRSVFTAKGTSFVPSDEMATKLRAIRESPWDDFELTRSKLAHRLKQYHIKTGHNKDATARGYRLEDFADTFLRYIPSRAVNPSEAQVKQGAPSDGLRAENEPPLCDVCGEELIRPESIARGRCAECALSANG